MSTKNSAQALRGSACLEKVLERLDKVSPRSCNKWAACCPAHLDKEPSLSISEGSDGRVLIHCWAGCETRDVVAAIGLEMRDLFPGEKRRRRGPSKEARLHEFLVYKAGLCAFKRREVLNNTDKKRFELACQRLGVKHDQHP